MIRIKKRLLKYMAYIHRITGVYLEKHSRKPNSEQNFSFIVMKAQNSIHVIICEGEYDQVIPEDGSFSGAVVFSNLSKVQAEDMLEKYNLKENGFTRVG